MLGCELQEMLLVLKLAVHTLSRNIGLIQRDEGPVLEYQASAIALPRKYCQSEFCKPLHWYQGTGYLFYPHRKCPLRRTDNHQVK